MDIREAGVPSRQHEMRRVVQARLLPYYPEVEPAGRLQWRFDGHLVQHDVDHEPDQEFEVG